MNGRAWILAALAALGLPGVAIGQDMPEPDSQLSRPETPSFSSARTAWGEPDLQGTWPVQNINDARIRLERPDDLAGQTSLTDEQYAERRKAAEDSDAEYSVDLKGGGTRGLADWLRGSAMGRRTSLLVDPPDGRMPPLTKHAQELYEQGRSTWQVSDAIDWVSDLDPFERCITRGFPAVMLPQPYNNGLRIFQSPGYVVLQMETFGTRVIPIGKQRWPSSVRAWHGDSRGYWDGTALVVETTNIVSGDSATYDVARRAAGPIPGRNNATLPVGPEAKVTERFQLTGPDTLDYRVTYDDQDVFTAPWTAAFERTRDEDYRIYEYACQEGSTVRNVITASRARRHTGKGGEAGD